MIISEKKREKKGFKAQYRIGIILGALLFFFVGNNLVFAQVFEQVIYSTESASFDVGSFDIGQTIYTNIDVATTTYSVSAVQVAMDKNSGLGSSLESCVYDGSSENCFFYATTTLFGGYPGTGGSVGNSGIFGAYSFYDLGDVRFVLFKPCDVNVGGVGTMCTFGESNVSSYTIGVPPNESLIILFGRNSGGVSVYGSSNVSSYIDGFMFDNTAGIPYVQSSDNVKDLYFQWYQSGETPLGYGDIQITVPQNGQSLLDDDFPRWGVQYLYSSSTIDRTFFGVRYGTSSQLINGVLDAQYADVVPLTIQGFASTTVNKTDFPPIGDYYAQAFIRVIPASGSLQSPYYVATSSVISFSLLSQGDPLNPPFLTGFGEGVIDWGDPCDALVWFSTTTIKNFFACALQPSTESQTAFKTALNGFANVFPFSLIFSLTNDTIDFLNVGTTTTSFVLTLSTPQGSFDSTLLSDTMLDDVGLSTFKNLYFTLVESIIWVGLGFLIYKVIV